MDRYVWITKEGLREILKIEEKMSIEGLSQDNFEKQLHFIFSSFRQGLPLPPSKIVSKHTVQNAVDRGFIKLIPHIPEKDDAADITNIFVGLGFAKRKINGGMQAIGELRTAMIKNDQESFEKIMLIARIEGRKN